MSETMTISEPTFAEFEAQTAAEREADNPSPTAAETAVAGQPARPPEHDRAGKWGLPRVNSSVAYGFHPETCRVGFAPRLGGHIKIELRAETELSGAKLVAEWRQAVSDRVHGDSHAAILNSPEYERAASILPQAAHAARKLSEATARLDAIQTRRTKLVAKPGPGLGKHLVEIEAQSAAVRAEIAEHKAEVDALAPAAASARTALARAAVESCLKARADYSETRMRLLKEKTAEFFASHSDELTEIALLSAVTAPERPADARAIVKLLEEGLVAPPDEAVSHIVGTLAGKVLSETA